MPSSGTLTTALPVAATAIAWLVAAGSWWLYRQRALRRARALGHLASVMSVVALLVPMAAEKIAAAVPPDGLTAPQAGLMAALSNGIVSGPPIFETIRTVLFVAVTASAAVVGIVVVVRCRRRADASG